MRPKKLHLKPHAQQPLPLQLVQALATGDLSAFVDLGELSRPTPDTRRCRPSTP